MSNKEMLPEIEHEKYRNRMAKTIDQYHIRVKKYSSTGLFSLLLINFADRINHGPKK